MRSTFDPAFPPGLQWYWKGDFFSELSDAAIAEHVRHGSRLPTPLSSMHFHPLDGAPQRVGRQETAFNGRDARWSEVIGGVDPDPANKEKIIDWTREYWDALHPYPTGGAYVNFMMEEGDDRIRTTYGENYERLVRVKARYDPRNLFRVNQNIPPHRHAGSERRRVAA